MSDKNEEVTINPNNGMVAVGGEYLSPESQAELWNIMGEEITKEIDNQIMKNIKNGDDVFKHLTPMGKDFSEEEKREIVKRLKGTENDE